MKQTRYILTLLITLTILVACNQQTNTTDNTLDPEYGGLTDQLADFYNSAGPTRQIFKINPDKDTIVVGRKGTALFISANSLVDDKLLVTQGMIYFQAENSNYGKVSINPNAPIRIETPSDEKPNPDAKIFKGIRDADGNINWTDPIETDKKLIPVPIKSMNPRGWTECPPDMGITNNDSIWNLENHGYRYIFDDINKFENTLIGTREFGQRFYCCCWEEVIKTYVENLDKNMWEIDEMMIEYYIKDSTKRVNYVLDNFPVGIDGGKPTKAQMEAHQSILDHAKEAGHRNIETFKNFASQKLTTVDTSRLLDTTSIKKFNRAFYAYEALEFGWVNVDYFYEYPNAEPVQLFVQTGNVQPTILNLAFPASNIMLTAIDMGEGKYRFTKNEDGYNKLPKGEKALIVGITYHDNQSYFVIQEITIGQNTTETIELTATTFDQLEKEIRKITAPNNG